MRRSIQHQSGSRKAFLNAICHASADGSTNRCGRFEFFAFPSYFTNVTGTNQCLANWKALTGVWPPIRIGGTTQDRASYDASTSAYVVYTVASPADAPATLTFGSKFMTLANTYAGTVVMGLNRGKNDLANTIAAAKVAVSEMGNLLAIELGNEPECEQPT